MQDLNTYGYWAICRPTGDDDCRPACHLTPGHFGVRCTGIGPRWVGMGWVGSWVHKFTWQWVGLGWISYLMGWVGCGSMKWSHGQLWFNMLYI